MHALLYMNSLMCGLLCAAYLVVFQKRLMWPGRRAAAECTGTKKREDAVLRQDFGTPAPAEFRCGTELIYLRCVAAAGVAIRACTGCSDKTAHR